MKGGGLTADNKLSSLEVLNPRLKDETLDGRSPLDLHISKAYLGGLLVHRSFQNGVPKLVDKRKLTCGSGRADS